jgi:hypothetical protein
MSTKKITGLAKGPNTPPATPPKRNLQAVIASNKDQEEERARAKLMLSPAAASAVASFEFVKSFGAPDIAALMHDLGESMKQVHGGDMKRPESMLIGQAHALQAIFMNLAGRSARCTTLKQTEMDMRLALKAQAQCCRTLEVLAAMKNPPVMFARQANVTTGPQQINNGTPAPGMVPACGNANPERNELLENKHVERVEPRTKSQTSQGHTPMGPMEAIHGAADR